MGNFFTELTQKQKKHYVGIAAGSGITPILSILKESLFIEPESRFTLIYANKNQSSVIFKDELEALLKKYSGRLEIHYVYSRENTGDTLLTGRLDKQKIQQILEAKNLIGADHYFICGPEEMIMNAKDILQTKNIDKTAIHFELFTTPVNMGSPYKTEAGEFTGVAKVKVTIDGIVTDFELDSNGQSILDAAMDAGADAPFSCKGAVCCTCKAKVIKGKAVMDMNYALTDKEVEQGYILSCQSHPQSAELEVDFDVA
jgi:ring-1,2-phenylacetyl-CoA epoxidase subunit PaaE